MIQTIEIPLARRKHNQWVANAAPEDHARPESTAFCEWHNDTGQNAANKRGFNMLLFGAAVAVIFPLMAQNSEQANVLRLAIAYHWRSFAGTCAL